MAEEHQPYKDTLEQSAKESNENQDEFDYSKMSDETDSIMDYLEQLLEEVTKMRVECSIANIELISAIDNIHFERKILELDDLYAEYMQQQQNGSETSLQN